MRASTVVNRLGLPGLLGTLLLGAAAWCQWGWLPPQREQVEAQASKARQLRHELLKSGPEAGGSASALTPAEAWQTLWQKMPEATQRTPLQSTVMASARERGLILTTVQFNGAAQGTTGLWRQRLILPVEGRYMDVRSWLGQLLSEPALSLDALDIQRTDVMSDTVKAKVSVSLWWRLAPAPSQGVR
jgi:hypothetical protein